MVQFRLSSIRTRVWPGVPALFFGSVWALLACSAADASPGEVTFTGDVIFTGSSTLIMELAGTFPGTEYDTITGTGSITLGGTLDIDLLDGFIPTPGNSFQLMTAVGGITGSFSNVLFPPLAAASWRLNYTANYVLLQVGLKGDYNLDGRVDAADYLVWRKSLGAIGFGLAADGNANHQIDPGDYDVWTQHFGASMIGGSSAASHPNAAVPEPATSAFVCCTLIYAANLRPRRSYLTSHAINS